MIKKIGFNIDLSSDINYEKMVVNLNFDSELVAILDCDKGIENAEIRISDIDEDRVVWTFKCKDFIKSLNIAF
jgi:hypothetical protein